MTDRSWGWIVTHSAQWWTPGHWLELGIVHVEHSQGWQEQQEMVEVEIQVQLVVMELEELVLVVQEQMMRMMVVSLAEQPCQDPPVFHGM